MSSGQATATIVALTAIGAGALAYVAVHHPDLFRLDAAFTPAAAVFLLAACALAVLVLRRPGVGLILVVAFVYLNLSQVLVRYHGLPSLLQLLALPLVLAVWLAGAADRWAPARLALTWLLALYVLVLACSTVLARDRELADADIVEHLKAFVVYGLIVGLTSSLVRLRRAVWTLVAAAATIAGLGVLQVLTGDFTGAYGGLARIKYAHIYGDVFEPRIAGPLGDPNFFSQILVAVVPLALMLALEARQVLQKMFWLGCAALIVAAAVLTYSRGGALAVAVVLMLALCAGHITRRQAALGVGFLLLILILLPPDFTRRLATLSQILPGSEDVLRPDSSFERRKLLTAVAWRIFLDHPIFGVGAANYTAYFEEYADDVGSAAWQYGDPGDLYYPHSLYLQLGAETGVVGLTAFALIVTTAFIYLRQARSALLFRGERSSAALAKGFEISLVGYLVSSLFLHGHFVRYLWMIFAFAGALRLLTIEEADETDAATVSSAGVDARREVGSGLRVRRAMAVLVSRFPLITETFVLREIEQLERHGQPVLLVPLLRETPAVVHREALPWIARALYTPFFSSAILTTNLRTFVRQPARYAALAARVVADTAASPAFLAKTLFLFPKSVYLAAQLEREGIRHVHAHFATHPAMTAYVIASLTDITFSVTAHAHDIFVDRTFLRERLRRASFVRVISRFNRDFLVSRYGPEVAGRIHVIHCGIDPDAFAAPTEPAASPEPPRLLAIAALKPYKGMPVLLEACKLLKARGVTFQCDVVGEGPHRGELTRLRSMHGLDNLVFLHGARRQDEIPQFLGRASIVVLPSIVAPDGQMDGLPVCLMEAMAAERPVVASRLSGIPELVEDGWNGSLVEPGNAEELANAIEVLLADPALRRRMGANGRQKVEHQFRLDRTVAELLQHLDAANDPPAADLDTLERAVTSAGAAGRAVGVRRIRDRKDSTVVELLVGGGQQAEELIAKVHKPASSGADDGPDRARREFQALVWLNEYFRAPTDGTRMGTLGVPRERGLDDSRACVVMERCHGVPLDRLIRETRGTRDAARQHAVRSAVHRAGGWLRLFQQFAIRGDVGVALDRLIREALEDLRTCAADGVSVRLADRIRARLLDLQDTLGARVSGAGAASGPARPDSTVDALRVVAHHGDFWPGNLHAGAEALEAIDFEGGRDGLPDEDVAYFLIQLELFFSRPFQRQQYQRLEAAFLDGYLAGGRLDPVTFELCRIAKGLQVLARGSAGMEQSRTAGWWRRRALRAIITHATDSRPDR